MLIDVNFCKQTAESNANQGSNTPKKHVQCGRINYSNPIINMGKNDNFAAVF